MEKITFWGGMWHIDCSCDNDHHLCNGFYFTGDMMKQKQVIRFMAYDDDLTDYVEVPELSKYFTKKGLPVEESVFHWFEGGKCKDHFKIEIIKSKIVDYDNSLHTDILAQPL